MDNFPEDNDLKNENSDENISLEGADIEFDEKIDLDALQKSLLAQDDEAEETQVIEGEQVLGENPTENPEQKITPEIPKDIQDIPELEDSAKQASSKKYVIYINPENVSFMENLSIYDRKLIINKILKEQNEKVKKEKLLEAQRRKIVKGVISVATFIVGVPLIFCVIDKSISVTVENYRQSKQNFEKLYREHGKIQPTVQVLPALPKV